MLIGPIHGGDLRQFRPGYLAPLHCGALAYLPLDAALCQESTLPIHFSVLCAFSHRLRLSRWLLSEMQALGLPLKRYLATHGQSRT